MLLCCRVRRPVRMDRPADLAIARIVNIRGGRQFFREMMLQRSAQRVGCFSGRKVQRLVRHELEAQRVELELIPLIAARTLVPDSSPGAPEIICVDLGSSAAIK